MKRAAGGALCILTLALAMPAYAREEYSGLGAAVRMVRYHTAFAVGQSSYAGDVTEVGFAIKQHFNDAFSMGMQAGYADMTLSHDPAMQGLSPSGHYGALDARYRLFFGAHFSLDFRAAGSYHRVSDSKAGGSIVERWWSYSVAAGPRLSYEYFGVEAGLVYRYASGREEASALTGPRSLAFEHTTNPYVDVTVEVSDAGTVGLWVEGGARRGAALVFGYRFESP